MALYDNPMPELLVLDGSFYTELGAEATWGLFFAGGPSRRQYGRTPTG